MQTSSVRLREPCIRRGDPDFDIYYYVFYADYYDKVRNPGSPLHSRGSRRRGRGTLDRHATHVARKDGEEEPRIATLCSRRRAERGGEI